VVQWNIALIGFERRKFCAGVDRRVNGKLSVGQMNVPVILQWTNEAAEILLQCTVHFLRLAVALRSVCYRHAQLRPDRLEDVLPEVGHKLPILIRHDVRWHAVQLPDVVDEESCNTLSCHRLGRGHEVTALGQSINDDPD
jgi:hypothetical protein